MESNTQPPEPSQLCIVYPLRNGGLKCENLQIGIFLTLGYKNNFKRGCDFFGIYLKIRSIPWTWIYASNLAHPHDDNFFWKSNTGNFPQTLDQISPKTRFVFGSKLFFMESGPYHRCVDSRPYLFKAFSIEWRSFNSSDRIFKSLAVDVLMTLPCSEGLRQACALLAPVQRL